MASISHEGNGRRRIRFVAGDGSRRTIRLGKLSERDAEQVCRHVEELNAKSIARQPISRETAIWVREIGDTLHERLARAGLLEGRGNGGKTLLAGFIDDYIAQRADLKPGTITLLRQARIWLVRFMGEDRRLSGVKPADADAYCAHMVKSELAKATIGKRCWHARRFFEVAKRRGLIESNPFGHIKIMVQGNPARRVFVPAADVDRVIASISDPQWKLLIALARYGGLRIPSEALALTWRDVDFEGRRFIVRASKTEHHAGGGIRVVPMFPQLAPHFQAVFDQAPEGATHVITRYRDASQNTRTQLCRHIVVAGLKPWGKPWQNMRASRATELADEFPSHVCAAWLGHTERVADTFYRQVTDSHFQRATKELQKAGQNPGQYGADSDGLAQIGESEDCQKPQKNQSESTPCEDLTNEGIAATGLEPVTRGL